MMLDGRSNWTWLRAFVLVCLSLHVVILVYSASVHFANMDEIAHLPSGVAHWKYQRFDMYRVNPPLVRLFAGFPAWLAGAEFQWQRYTTSLAYRPEFAIGRAWIKEHGLDIHGEFFWPRILCIPFSVLGCLVLVGWTRQVLGSAAAGLVCVLWCFSPNILTSAATILPDVGMVALGVLAAYVFYGYLRSPAKSTAALAGVCLGLAMLCKLTWLSALVSMPVAVLMCRWLFPRVYPVRAPKMQLVDVALVWGAAIMVVNAGYLFEGSFKPLGDYGFCSKVLGGEYAHPSGPRNRFESSWLRHVPVPLPRNYVLGIDYLKHEVEDKKWSFLDGQWKLGGWYHYYVVTTLIKTPLPTLLAALLGLGVVLTRLKRRAASADSLAMLLLLGVPALVVFLMVSLQAGFNHHHRYVLVVYPALFALAAFPLATVARDSLREAGVSLGQAEVDANSPPRQWLHAEYWDRHIVTYVVVGLACWSTVSSLRVHPHYETYFNAIAGGPQNGWRYLASSNIEWGQDLLFVDDWIAQHPECRPLAFELDSFSSNGELFGLTWSAPPKLPEGATIDEVRTDQTQWWIVSVKKLFNHPGEDGLAYLQQIEPIDRIGYSYHVYRIDPVRHGS